MAKEVYILQKNSTLNMLKKKNLKSIHKASELLRSTIEEYAGKKAIVMYAVVDDDDHQIASGITLSDNIESQDLEQCVFRLLGRAYNMVDYD